MCIATSNTARAVDASVVGSAALVLCNGSHPTAVGCTAEAIAAPFLPTCAQRLAPTAVRYSFQRSGAGKVGIQSAKRRWQSSC